MEFSWAPKTISEINRFVDLYKSIPEKDSRSDKFDRETWNLFAHNGLFKIPSPSKDSNLLTTAAIFEALGKNGMNASQLFAMGAHLYGCQIPIELHAKEIHHSMIADSLANGSLVGALAMTDRKRANSIHSGVTATVSRNEKDYILNGGKTFVTNGPIADIFLIIASTDVAKKSFGWTALVAEKGTPGMQIKPLNTLGLKGAPMSEIEFNNCHIPKLNQLGPTNAGLNVFLTAMNWERTAILAGLIGVAEFNLSQCLKFSIDRQSQGISIASHQVIAHKFAKIKTKLECCRLLLYKAAWSIDTKQSKIMELASMTKYEVSEMLLEVSLEMSRITAGSGWIGEIGTLKTFIDITGTLFASGTSEIQLNTIARSMGLKTT